jgi:hypothetical protein
LWLCATFVLAVTPLLVFAAGASDSTTHSDQVRLGILVAALAWPLLIGARYVRSTGEREGRLRSAVVRGSLLELYGACAMALAWEVARGPVFTGDAGWAAFWLVAAALWLALSRAVLLR